MRYKNENDFSKALKSGGVRSPVLLYGNENYLIGRWKKEMLAPFGGELGFNLQKLDGRRPDLNELYDASQALPLMADQKCVLLDDLDAGALSADDLKNLDRIFQELPPECTLVITALAPGFDPKSAAAKKLIALADRHGSVVQLDGRDSAALVRFLQSVAAERGCTISPALCKTVLDTCDNAMLVLRSEMEKLCAFAGGGEIKRPQLDAVLIPRTEAKVFDLSKAILAGSAQRAMEILSDLFYLREKPVAILSALIISYVDLYRARIARDQRVSQQELVSHLGYQGREFRVRNAWRGTLSAAALRRCLEILYDCDRKLKSTGLSEEFVLEQAVISLFAQSAQSVG